MPWFRKPKYTIVRAGKKDIPADLWSKCKGCGRAVYNKRLKENLYVCPHCDYHFTLGAKERISLVVDEGSFHEFDADMSSVDPLNFKGPKKYTQKLEKDKEMTGLSEAAVTGQASIEKHKIMIGVTDSRFIMGSMGSVVGEKLTRLIEKATQEKLPLIIVSGSGGGARMYEGMYSLMQMAKTSAAIYKHKKAELLYISVLTNPTMAGVMASFAGLGDIIMAEPRALVGFTGPRVIKQTIKQDLPEGFQSSEFMLEHGLLDKVVHRRDLKETLDRLLNYLS